MTRPQTVPRSFFFVVRGVSDSEVTVVPRIERNERGVVAFTLHSCASYPVGGSESCAGSPVGGAESSWAVLYGTRIHPDVVHPNGEHCLLPLFGVRGRQVAATER